MKCSSVCEECRGTMGVALLCDGADGAAVGGAAAALPCTGGTCGAITLRACRPHA